MSSLRFETDRTRKGWRLQFYTLDKRKRSLWIGEVSKKKAGDIQRFVDELLSAKRVGRRPEGDAAAWIEGLQGRMRDALVKCDLCKPYEQRPTGEESTQLGAFIDHYLKLRTDLKAITLPKFAQVRSYSTKYFGERRSLESITEADFEQWNRWMRSDRLAADGKTIEKKLAQATANKHAKRLRQMLQFAVKSRLLTSNPGAGCKLGSETNPARQFFITRPMATAILEQCPDTSWKLIFALPRFAGLRCPTEVLDLRWSDVDWEKSKLRIDSIKTGLRFCPIFPLLRPILEETWQEAAKDSKTGQPSRDAHVVVRYRSTESNLRTHMLRLVVAAGYTPWEKIFVNLRSSCRTELEESFPSHVVNAWLGHSTKVAQDHYLQVTGDHWERAAKFDSGSIGGSTGGDVPTLSKNQGVRKPNKKKAQTTRKDSKKLG